MIIYNSDGTERYVKDENVKIIHLNSEDFISMKNVHGGVTMFYKDNKNIYLENAHTKDGITLTIL
jgi:hypothetical protein